LIVPSEVGRVDLLSALLRTTRPEDQRIVNERLGAELESAATAMQCFDFPLAGFFLNENVFIKAFGWCASICMTPS
jgi:hypothetical protein